MENQTNVGKQALRYRIVINEIVGVIISLALSVIIAILLYFLKVKYGLLIDMAVFVIIFLIQFIVIYVFSQMQYKNLRYVLGQNAITFQRGAFSTESETIPFEKIKNSTFDQSFIQRLFSVGDITIDQDDEKYTWENVDTQTATAISNTVSAKGDVQPITLAAANVITNPTKPAK